MNLSVGVLYVCETVPSNFLTSTCATAVPPTSVSKLTKEPCVKRPWNPFVICSNIERMKIFTRAPSTNNADISKQLGFQWNRLSSAERKPFIEEAERLRQLHLQKQPDNKYDKRPRKRAKMQKTNENGLSNLSAVNAKLTKKPRVKRPWNPFIIWSNIERKKILTRAPGTSNTDISKQLGIQWNRLSSAERKPFVEEAERLRQLHLQNHPDNKYDNRPRKRAKMRKTNENGLTNLSEVNATTSSNVVKKVLLPNRTSSKVVHRQPFTCVKSSTSSIASKQIYMENKMLTCACDIPNCNNPEKDHSCDSAFIVKHSSVKNLANTENSTKNDFGKSSLSFALDDTASTGNVKDSVKDVSITKKVKDSSSSEKSSCLGEALTSTNINQVSSLNKEPYQFQVGGSLTAGSICAIAHARKDEWSETFDFLTDNLTCKVKEADEEIAKLAKAYHILKKGAKTAYLNFNIPECAIPNLSDILGENWNNLAFKFND